MCQYHHYYFAKCRHQHTALIDFCDRPLASHDPEPIPDSSQAPAANRAQPTQQPPSSAPSARSAPPPYAPQPGTRPAPAPKSGRPNGKDIPVILKVMANTTVSTAAAETEHAIQRQRRTAEGQHLPPSPSRSLLLSSDHDTPSSPSSATSVSTSFTTTSIPESASDAASIPIQQQILSHHTLSAHGMTGLGPFSKGSFGRWFAGGSAKSQTTQAASPVTSTRTTNHNDPDMISASKARSLRLRRSGMKEQTDESCNISDSTDTLRHFAGSCRSGTGRRDSVLDQQRLSSYETDVDNRSAYAVPACDDSLHRKAALELEIDALKEQIKYLRAEADRSCSTAQTKAKSQPQRGEQSEHEIKQPESTAARLQRQHQFAEEQELLRAKKIPHKPAVPMFSRLEFPQLGNNSQIPLPKNQSASDSNRKLSYADAIGQKAPANTDRSRVTASARLSTKEARLGPRESRPIRNAATEADLGDDSVLYTPVSDSQNEQASAQTCTVKGEPSSSSKPSPGFARPTKAFSRRADETLRQGSMSPASKVTPSGSPTKSIRTLTQGPTKRKSLPSGWVNAAPETTSTNESSTPKPSEPIRKDASFMSPTKATMRREIATLGQENPKHTSPRAPKSVPTVNIAVAQAKNVEAPELSASSGSTEYITAEEGEEAFKEPKSVNGVRCAVPQYDGSASPPPASAKVPDIFEVSKAPLHQAASTSVSEEMTCLPRRSTIGTSVRDVFIDQCREKNLPIIPNTTTKRRGSHGHLLRPILPRLEKHGVRYLFESAVPEDTAQQDPLTHDIHGSLSTPVQATNVAREIIPHPLKGLPPHLRRKAMSSGENEAPAVSDFMQRSMPTQTSPLALQPITLASQTQILRATAAEFKPMAQTPLRQLVNAADTADVTIAALLDYKSPEEWNSMSPEMRSAVLSLRQDRRNRAISATFPRNANQRYWNGISTQQGPAPLHQRDTLGEPYQGALDMALCAANAVKPHIDLGTHQIQWTIRNDQGQVMPINFGRAAAPQFASPPTPVVSPTSDNTTPARSTLSTPRGWTIGSAMPKTPYGWKGGDGKEIKFRGYGPDAERNPNIPVNFAFAGRSGQRTAGPRMVGESEESDFVPLAPRSRAQWAKQFGRMPCDTVNFTQSVEIPHPLPPHLAYLEPFVSNCFDCAQPIY